MTRITVWLAFLWLSSCRLVVAQDFDGQWAHLFGYAEKDRSQLTRFLDDWHAASKPISNEQLSKKPAFERTVYEMFRAFYRPSDEFYANCGYAVIQNKVAVRLMDSDMKAIFSDSSRRSSESGSLVRGLREISRFSIEEFRPPLKLDGKKVLYLQHEQLSALVCFLTDDWTVGPDRYWHVKCTGKARKQRLEYLNSALQIFPGHWGVGWHFETHPFVSRVYLNNDFTRAIVDYRVYYGGESALMERKGDDWRVVARHGSWVE